jgi:hypothetical protein
VRKSFNRVTYSSRSVSTSCAALDGGGGVEADEDEDEVEALVDEQLVKVEVELLEASAAGGGRLLGAGHGAQTIGSGWQGKRDPAD